MNNKKCYNKGIKLTKEAIFIEVKNNKNLIVVSSVIGLCLLVILLVFGFGHHPGKVYEATTSINGQETPTKTYYVFDERNHLYGSTTDRKKALEAGHNVRKSLNNDEVIKKSMLYFKTNIKDGDKTEIGNYQEKNNRYSLEAVKNSISDNKTKPSIAKASSNTYTELDVHDNRVTIKTLVAGNGKWDTVATSKGTFRQIK